MFNTVRINFDSIEWSNQLDLDPELLYNKSKKVRGTAHHQPVPRAMGKTCRQ